MPIESRRAERIEAVAYGRARKHGPGNMCTPYHNERLRLLALYGPKKTKKGNQPPKTMPALASDL
jgi:hypothetical protein